jgi:uncharacterized protein (TIGR02217 family)
MAQTDPFHEVRFPLYFAFGATGGPVRRTEIVTLGSGREQRNARWAQSRRRYDAGQAIRSLEDLAGIVEFFEARRGRLFGFRFRDPLDHKSCPLSAEPSPFDQALGTGDGTRVAYELVKGDSADGFPARRIRKPIAGTVLVAVGAQVMTPGADFSVDEREGVVTFVPQAAPAAGLPVTAGYEFDLPVRFDTDELQVSLAAFAAGEIPAIPIVEVLS